MSGRLAVNLFYHHASATATVFSHHATRHCHRILPSYYRPATKLNNHATATATILNHHATASATIFNHDATATASISNHHAIATATVYYRYATVTATILTTSYPLVLVTTRRQSPHSPNTILVVWDRKSNLLTLL